MAPERCPVCEWTNINLINYGLTPNVGSRWACHGCAARLIGERDEAYAWLNGRSEGTIVEVLERQSSTIARLEAERDEAVERARNRTIERDACAVEMDRQSLIAKEANEQARSLRSTAARLMAVAKRAILIGQTALADEGHDHDECEHWNELTALSSEVARMEEGTK